MRRLRDWVVEQLRKRGIVLLPAWRLETLAYRDHLRRIVELYRPDCVLDVGANLGQFGDRLRKEVGWSGPIISFEPVSMYRRVLEERVADDVLWRVVPSALGNECCEREINVLASPGLASMHEPDTQAMRSLLPAPEKAVMERKERVRIRRLDDVLPEVTGGLNAGRIFLKCDTQGHDLEVIRGATSTLEKCVALQLEVSVLSIYQGTPHWLDAIREISGQGFDVSGLFPVLLDRELRVIEFDCVLVRSPRRKA